MIDKNVCEKQQINYKKTTPSIGQLHVHVSESRHRGKINTFINGLYRSARQRANSLLIDHYMPNEFNCSIIQDIFPILDLKFDMISVMKCVLIV